MLIVPILTIAGEPVGHEVARELAQSFILAKKSSTTRKKVRAVNIKTLLHDMGEASVPYYVFNVGQSEGFVIVSVDDDTDPILAYSTTGELDSETIPPQMRTWLQSYAEEIQKLRRQPTNCQQALEHQYAKPTMAISPLLQTTWNQDSPYNNLCPELNGIHTVTGCVATAIAQVMKYHEWPPSIIKQIPAYYCGQLWEVNDTTQRFHLDAIPAGTTLAWNDMVNNYVDTESDEQKTAIAQLMKSIGTAVQMEYRRAQDGGSGAQPNKAVKALQEYFGYSPTIRREYRNNFSLQAWQNMICEELQAGRPVLYTGNSSQEGHAFVIDGYDGDGFFHINWGWGGRSNGYYRLSVAKPDEASGSTKQDGYSSNQSCIIGIKPFEKGDKPVQYLTATLDHVDGNAIYYSMICNRSDEGGLFNYGIGYYDEEEKLVIPIDTTRVSLRVLQNIPQKKFSVEINKLPDNSTSRLFFISKTTESDKWIVSPKADIEYVNAKITEGGLTLTPNQMAPLLRVQTINFVGNKKTNIEQNIRVTIKNQGGEFYGQQGSRG